MSLRFPLQERKFATIVSVYVPMMTKPEVARIKFYEDLQAILASMPKADKLIALGDFNTRVGTDHAAWSGALGPHGLSGCNDNGRVLLRNCVEQRLIPTNSFFRILIREKATRMHPRPRHWHLLDYVLHHFSSELAQRLVNLPVSAVAISDEGADFENRWGQLRDTVQSTAQAVLGRAHRHHQDWLDDIDAVISNLLVERNRLHNAYVDRPTDDNRAAFHRSRHLVQQRLRETQDARTACKTEEIQGYADLNK
ncbi:hypothetical protein SprV_0100476700 [Sparganum proliferum]